MQRLEQQGYYLQMPPGSLQRVPLQ